jgi:drug/metabolite transporter (DMT)-like permease
MLFIILLYAGFASVFTISKTGLEHAQPFFFVGSRMLLAGLLMLAYQGIFQKQEFKFKKVHFWRIFRLAAFNIYLTNVFEFWGLQYLTSFKTCFIYSLSPFVSALLSYLMFNETMTNKKWVGLCIGFAGFIPILLSQTTTEEAAGQVLFFSWAELSVMVAAVSSVYGWILLRQLVRENEYSPLMANGLSMLIGGFLALLHSFYVEDWNPIPIFNLFPFLECALLLILISNLICYNLYGYLLKKYSATFISFAGFITPIFSAMFGWFYLNEVMTWPFYLSTIIVFAGLLLFYQEELKDMYKLSEATSIETA